MQDGSGLNVHNSLVAGKVAKMLESVPADICWFGDPLLRHMSIPFSEGELDQGVTQKISDKLTKVLDIFKKKLNLGRGLAAPQIGISKRMFVVYDSEHNKYDTYVNPIIRSYSDTHAIYKEMCLSGLPLAASVVRPWEVELEYYDLDGHHHTVTPAPMLSRIVQHETDHLDGILFTDRADPKSISFEFDWEKFRAGNRLVKLDNI